MTEILTINNSLATALEEGIKSAEQGDFNRTIKLLTYVKENKKDYDKAMVTYFLLYSTFAVGELTAAHKYLEELDAMNISDEQILPIINDIRTKLSNVDINDQFVYTLNKIYNKCDELNLFDKQGGYFLELIKNRDNEDSIKTLRELYFEAIDLINVITSVRENYDLTNDLVVEKEVIFRVTNRLLINGFFFELIEPQDAYFLMNVHLEKLFPSSYKNLIRPVYIALTIAYSTFTYMTHDSISEICKVDVHGCEFNTIDIFECIDEIDIILNNSNKINYEILINSVFAYIGYYDVYNSRDLLTPYTYATIAYLIDDMFELNQKNEIKEKTNIEFDENVEMAVIIMKDFLTT